MRLCFALSAMLCFAHVAGAAEQKRPLASDTLKPPQRNTSASPITDRFALRVLYWPASLTTDLRLDSEGGRVGTQLIAEDELGLDDSTSEARAELIFRLRERNRLRVDYLKLSRLGDKIITRPINFGDETFLVNDLAQTALEWRNLTFTYTRSVIWNPRFEVGLGLGISILEAKARGDVVRRNVRERQDGVGAFPTFALDGTWRISRRWAFTARAQRFTAQVDDFEGSLADYHADVQYRWRENFAIGLGYTKLRTLVDVGDDDGAASNDLTGRFDQKMTGPELFLRASF
jgi:hypothetical protein